MNRAAILALLTVCALLVIPTTATARYVDGMSLYRAYFTPRKVDPFGSTTIVDDTHDGFDPEWLESSGCYDYCIAAGHSPSRCLNFCKYDNPPSDWPVDPPHPDWPIAWGEEIPFDKDFPLPEWGLKQDGTEDCKCTWDRDGDIYEGFNVERPAGINGQGSQPGFTTAPCEVGKKAIMKYLGTCEKRIDIGTCECESTCYVYRLWECKRRTRDTPTTPGGTMWTQVRGFPDHYSKCE